MFALHSIPDAFTKGECEVVLKTLCETPAGEAHLVGQKSDHSHRNSKLVWIDEVAGMEWVMDRLIDLVRQANKDEFEFDLHEFA
jgi:PKHD-type hydroxylase